MNDTPRIKELVKQMAALHQEEIKSKSRSKTWRRLEKRVFKLDCSALIVLEPELEAIITEILRPIEEIQPHQGHFQRIVRFIEKLTRQNITVRSVEDREELAGVLTQALRGFHGRGPHSGDLMTLVFGQIHDSIVFFRASSYSILEVLHANRESTRQAHGTLKSTEEMQRLALERLERLEQSRQMRSGPGLEVSMRPQIPKAWPPEFRASHIASL